VIALHNAALAAAQPGRNPVVMVAGNQPQPFVHDKLGRTVLQIKSFKIC